MELRVEELADNISRVTPVGRWDADGASTLNPQLGAVVASGRRIIVDMSEIEYMSSIGIRSLIAASQSAVNNGGRLVLLSPTPRVAEVLTIARISHIIPVCDDLGKARRALAA